MAERPTISGSVKVLNKQEKDAGVSGTLTALAAAAGKVPHLHGIIISTNTAGTYTVNIGATSKLEVYLGANSGYSEKFHPFFLTNNAANEAITITKPSGATTSATIFYTLEPAV